MAPVEPDAHTLYSPSKKYFNRNDSSFSEAHGHASFSSVAGSSPGLCRLETPESRSLGSDRVLLLVVVPLSIRLPPRFNFTGFRGISAERSVLVYLLCPPPPRRSSHPFFTARGIMRQQDSPAFAEFRRRNAGLLVDDIAFRLCLWNLWSVANFD